MTDLLRHRIETLRLRQTAPWPSAVAGIRDMINRWRAEQRLRLADEKHPFTPQKTP